MSEMRSMTLNGKKYDGFVDPVARAFASASAVINSASGERITLSDSSDNELYGLNIYGRTTQDGTPTPEAPIALKSAGNGGNVGVVVSGKNLVDSIYGEYIPLSLPAGTLLTASCDNPLSDDMKILFYDSQKNRVEHYAMNLTAKNGRSYATFTLENDAEYIMFAWSNVSTITKAQLTIGYATEYEPYKGQSLEISTPNGLRGIPVTSGGNYTDANGQQWICDEIDLTRGVRVQRINVVGFENAVGVRSAYPAGGDIYRFEFWPNDNPTYLPGEYQFGMCNALAYDTLVVSGNKVDNAICAYNNGGIFVRCDTYKTVETFIAWAKSIGLEVQYVLTTPIETPLSEEEIAAYSALHTYRGNTTVSNDGSAHMELEYVMDAKKYIDRLFVSGGGATARLANVTLLASAWKGSDSLYSQVVTIDGITEYSKVDLLPSVEQLAIFYNKDVTFVTENEGGVVTVYAIGDKPTQDYTMQAQITEVAV